MEGNVLTGTMLSGISSGMLDMEMSLQHHQNQHHQHQHPQSHHPLANHHIQAMLQHSAGIHVSTGHGAEQSLALMDSKGLPKNFMVCSKGKPNTSDEDEPSFTEDGNDSHLSGGKSKKNSPWQRMKWTDSMVRLLITMVSYVGDDGGLECNDANKKKSGILQKKGKWKSVSRAMMDKGCFVSPQQCEDKFNDLNKRYKRLNDILGRGIACRVVENPTLLDSMDHLSAKLKDDVRKLLSSKHLFFKEMCAYHNGHTMHFPPDLDFQQCLQSSLSGKNRDGHEACRMTNEENGDDEEDEENDGDEDEDDEDNDDENGEDAEVEGMGNYSKRRKMSENPEEVNFWSAPATHCGKPSGSCTLNAEMASVLQDNTKTVMEQKLWMRTRSMQLEEQKVSYQAQAFELEKQRFKWQRVSGKKLRELERMKLENERMKLENERMALQLKQKELEIEFKRSETSAISVSHLFEKFQGREKNELGVKSSLAIWFEHMEFIAMCFEHMEVIPMRFKQMKVISTRFNPHENHCNAVQAHGIIVHSVDKEGTCNRLTCCIDILYGSWHLRLFKNFSLWIYKTYLPFNVACWEPEMSYQSIILQGQMAASVNQS